MGLTPNEELAQKIASQLVAEGLIGREDGVDLLAKLKNGKSSIGDWKVWAENVIENRESDSVDSTED